MIDISRADSLSVKEDMSMLFHPFGVSERTFTQLVFLPFLVRASHDCRQSQHIPDPQHIPDHNCLSGRDCTARVLEHTATEIIHTWHTDRRGLQGSQVCKDLPVAPFYTNASMHAWFPVIWSLVHACMHTYKRLQQYMHVPGERVLFGLSLISWLLKRIFSGRYNVTPIHAFQCKRGPCIPTYKDTCKVASYQKLSRHTFRLQCCIAPGFSTLQRAHMHVA